MWLGARRGLVLTSMCFEKKRFGIFALDEDEKRARSRKECVCARE